MPLQQRKKHSPLGLATLGLLMMMLCFIQCDEMEDSWIIATGVHPVEFDKVSSSEKIIFSDSVLLSWQDRSALANDIAYQIIKDKTTQTTSDTFCILENLMPNSSLLLTIRSERKRNGHIFAEQSISIKAIHDSIVPVLPATDQAIYSNPFFSWQLEHIFFSHRAFHYELYIDSSASFSHPQVFSTTHDTLTARGIAIQKDQQYFWKVAIVYDDYPEKFFSKTMTFIGANEAPSVPQLISPANNATGVASPVTFTWHRSTDPENDLITYTLEVKDPNQKTIFTQANITDTFLQGTLSLASETNYTWRVIAKDRTGNSSSVDFTFTSALIPFLDIDKNVIAVDASGGNDTFHISTNTSWSISSPPSWFTLSTSSGTKSQRIIIQSQPNTASNSSRQITLTITSTNASLSKTITIIQESECAKNRRLDSLVLVKFYQSTNGASWTTKSGWLTSTPLHQWYKITMSSDGCRVGTIQLARNNLSGNIPNEIGNLTGLSILWLQENSLSNAIPKSIGNLSNLYSLALHYNSLSDTIPSEIGKLTRLAALLLHRNQLSGSIPKEIGKLSNLMSLYLDNNRLSGNIPTEIGDLVSLNILSLGVNQLDGEIPTSIEKLVNLQILSLDQNKLDGEIPANIGNLIKLEALSLEDNQLSGAIPESIGNLSKLNSITLHNNQLSGAIPESIGGMTELVALAANNNQLTSIPVALYSLINLQSVDLSQNPITGSLLPAIGNLTDLTKLSIANTQLTGNIPSAIGSLQKLQTLKLNNNQFNGEIPSEIGDLNNLVEFDVNTNQLSGVLPSNFCPRIQNNQYLLFRIFDNSALTSNCP